MYKHKNTGDVEEVPELNEEAASSSKKQPVADSIASPGSPFNHNLLDMRKQLYIQDEPMEHNMIKKNPATIMMS